MCALPPASDEALSDPPGHGLGCILLDEIDETHEVDIELTSQSPEVCDRRSLGPALNLGKHRHPDADRLCHLRQVEAFLFTYTTQLSAKCFVSSH